MKQPLRMAALFAVLAFTFSSQAQAFSNVSQTSLQRQIRSLRYAIGYHRLKAWRLEDRAGVTRDRTVYAERHTASVAFLRWDDRLWLHRQKHARALAEHRAKIGHKTFAATGYIAHRGLWLCIHSREGAWNDQGAPYYGGLQMTYGWDGLVSDAGDLSPDAQMAAAETGYRQNHYSISWLEGQWPNSSPPCLRYA